MTLWVRILLLAIFSWFFLPLTSSLPVNGTIFDRYQLGESTDIPISELYDSVPLCDVPTTIADEVVLFNRSDLRYGYFVGRPVERVIQQKVVKFIKPVVSAFFGNLPSMMHWAVLVSKEAPDDEPDFLPPDGKVVKYPTSGTVFELRNSAHTGLVYLDVKNWPNYPYRLKTVTYLGTLNKTDDELLKVGRVYIQRIGREGFHNFYRNCQVFASWFAKSFWPEVCLAQRADELLGKFLWWFKDPKKTMYVGTHRVKGWLGYNKKKLEGLDSATKFIPWQELLAMRNQTMAAKLGGNCVQQTFNTCS